MRIRQVALFEVEIPPIATIAEIWPKIYDLTLVKLSTDEGLVGWGGGHTESPERPFNISQ